MLDAREFEGIIKAMASRDKAAMVTITQESSETVAIFCGGITQRIQTAGQSLDYPVMPECSTPVQTLTPEQIATITGMTFATASYDKSSVMGGVNLVLNGRLDACATDGSRMVHFADSLTGITQTKINAVLPAHGFAPARENRR